MAKLLNTALAAGMYNDVIVEDETELLVELSALSVVKTANRNVWVDGALEYTIVVTNIYLLDPEDPDSGQPVTGISLTDTIVPEIATLIPGTVTIDGEAAEATDYTFNPVTGRLDFITLTDLIAGESHTVTFQVSLVQQP